MFKKFLVITLALIMVFTMIPAVAFGGTSAAVTVNSYDDLISAIGDVPAGGTATINVVDINIGGDISGIDIIGKNITFNFINSSISVSNGYVFFIIDSNVVINADDDSQLNSSNSDSFAGVIRIEDSYVSDDSDYELTINGGSYKSGNGNGALIASTNCTITVNEAIVNGGLYEVFNTSDLPTGEIIVNSGRFTIDVEEFVSEGNSCYNANNYYYVRDKEISDEFKELIPNGSLTFNYAPPKEDSLWVVLEEYVMNNYDKDVMIYVDSVSDDMKTCEVIIHEGTGREEVHAVNIIWNYDSVKYNLMSSYVDKFPQDREWFNVTDLEFVNYFVNLDPNSESEENTLANYSGELKKIIDNLNYTLSVRLGAGGDSPFCTEAIGEAKFKQDGSVYYVSNMLGARAEHIIYVADDTPNTKEALLKAAQDRVDEYFGKDGHITLSYAGTAYDALLIYEYELAKIWDPNLNLTFDQWKNDPANIPQINDFEDYIGVDGILEDTNTYKATFGENSFFFVIRKDSSKMVTPTHKTVDINTKVEIATEDSSVPLDAMIQAEKLTSGAEYDKVMKALDIEKGEMYDLGLYSNTLGKNVTKLENGMFEVKIPLSDDLKDKENLVVLYADDNGKVTPHEVTKTEDGYAVFETNHFSIYTLTEALAGGTTTPPTTGDANAALLWVGAALVAVGGITVARKRKEQ